MMRRKILSVLCLACLMLMTGCGEKQETVTVVPAAEKLQVAEDNGRSAEAELSGQFYGYWEIYDAEGEWAELKNSRWDCCALLYEGKMLLWDEDIWKDPGLALLEINQDGTELSISGGRFLDSEEGCENWDIRLLSDDFGGVLEISGRYQAVHGGEFSLVMFLRQWGDRWPEENRPDNYEFWYLPLIEDGREMPDSIG